MRARQRGKPASHWSPGTSLTDFAKAGRRAAPRRRRLGPGLGRAAAWWRPGPDLASTSREGAWPRPASAQGPDTACTGTGPGQTSACEAPACRRPRAPSHNLHAPFSLGPEAGLRRQAEPGVQCSGASWDAGQAASAAVHPGIRAAHGRGVRGTRAGRGLGPTQAATHQQRAAGGRDFTWGGTSSDMHTDMVIGAK